MSGTTGPTDPVRPWPAYHNALAWAAGVLDGAGRFRLYRLATGHLQSRVFASVPPETARGLAEILGGSVRGRLWQLDGSAQDQALRTVLPYLRGRYEEASRVLQFRLTVTRGGRQSEETRGFREGLLAKQGRRG